ncbi:MAG: ATP-binding protein [Saprospiraceae bacterium]
MTSDALITLTEELTFQLNKGQILSYVFGHKATTFLNQCIGIIESSQALPHDHVSKCISYLWVFQVKDVAILMRDLTLQLQKAEQHVIDKLRTDDESAAFQQKVYDITLAAVEETRVVLQRYREGAHYVQPEWKHQSNPASVVKQQVKISISQIGKILESNQKFRAIRRSFEEYKSDFNQICKDRRVRLVKLQEFFDTCIDSLDKLPSPIVRSEVNKLVSLFDRHSSFLDNTPITSGFNNIILEDVDRLVLPVKSHAGALQYKTIDVLSEVSSWSSLNLGSRLTTADRNLSLISEKLALLIFQTSNKFKAVIESTSSEHLDIKKDDLLDHFNTLHNDFENKYQPSILKDINDLEDLLQNYLNISQLYDEKHNFLPLSKVAHFTSELSKKLNDENYLYSFKNTVKKYLKSIFPPDDSQRMVSLFIEKMVSTDHNDDEFALFKRKGYLGSSFTVKRDQLEAKMGRHFGQWIKGYSGALCVIGSTGSGKSTLIEKFPLSHPELISHHIVEGQFIDINGRKHQIDNDLLDTLREIIKYQGDEKVIVTIDNLEYFRHDPESMFEMFDGLVNIIQKHSHKIYFLICIHTNLWQRLHHFFDLDQIFTNVIDTADLSPSTIEQALITRAVALYDYNDLPTEEEHVSQKAQKISKSCYNNIGLAMQMWRIKDIEKTFTIANKRFELLVSKYSFLLSLLTRHGSLNFLEIKNMLDAKEYQKYTDALHYLVSQKILVRTGPGLVMIHPKLHPLIDQLLLTHSNYEPHGF